MRKVWIWLPVVLMLMTICIWIPDNAEAISVDNNIDGKVVEQGKTYTVSVTVNVDYETHVSSVEIVFEWRETEYSCSNADFTIGSGEEESFSISFDVPKDTPTTEQTFDIYINGNWENGGTVIVVDAPPPKEKKDDSSTLTIIIISSVILLILIVVGIVLFVTIKKKPAEKQVVQVIQERKDDKLTRVKLPPRRESGHGGFSQPGRSPPSGRSSMSTQPRGGGGRDIYTTRGPSERLSGGPIVVFPNGNRKNIGNELKLGRNNFQRMPSIKDVDQISRDHCRLWMEGGKYYVLDGHQGKPSMNGTFFNGKDISGLGRQEITTNGVLRLGKVAEVRIMLDSLGTMIGR